MQRNTLYGLIFGAALTLAGACSSDSSTGPSQPPPPPPPSQATGTVNLRNDASVAIVAVYISSCDDATWGSDRLNAGEEIAPGMLRSFTMPAGCYDVKASTGTKSGSWYDRSLPAGGAINLALPATASSSVATSADMLEEGSWSSLKAR
jgi:hypothetical protein